MKAWLRRWVAERLARIRYNRQPDFVIGGHADPYMERWWLLPRNPLFNVYIHRIWRSDDDRALHDHPWPSLSWVIHGGYTEVLFNHPWRWRRGMSVHRVRRERGDLIFRWPWQAHRLEVARASSAVTLFITGPVVRRWGFYCPQGWRPWRQFVSSRDTGSIGAGCG